MRELAMSEVWKLTPKQH